MIEFLCGALSVLFPAAFVIGGMYSLIQDLRADLQLEKSYNRCVEKRARELAVELAEKNASF